MLLVGALGVVFGDIGTSPLYAMQTVFSPDALRPVPVEETAIYGAISLVFWSITVIVTVMYVLTFMRTDNDGRGGPAGAARAAGREPACPPRRSACWPRWASSARRCSSATA